MLVLESVSMWSIECTCEAFAHKNCINCQSGKCLTTTILHKHKSHVFLSQMIMGEWAHAQLNMPVLHYRSIHAGSIRFDSFRTVEYVYTSGAGSIQFRSWSAFTLAYSTYSHYNAYVGVPFYYRAKNDISSSCTCASQFQTCPERY